MQPEAGKAKSPAALLIYLCRVIANKGLRNTTTGVLLFFVSFFPTSALKSEIVTGIHAEYHDGQIFITWNNIPGANSGFYHVYGSSQPITTENIQTSDYLGRVLWNFGYDYRLSYSIADSTLRYLVTNDNPFTVLDPTQNLFVMNCTEDGASWFFAVLCDLDSIPCDSSVVPGSNATDVAVTGYTEPIRAYLQESKLKFEGAKAGEKMDVYIHYGGNVATADYPAMANEGCLAFHFGIIKEGNEGGNNACFLKFHGGNGTFFTNAITVHIEDAWKISFDDWVPAYGYDSTGNNTRWLGYHDQLDVYTYNEDTPPPDSGTVRAYTYHRVKWEFDWIRKTWPGTIDTTRVYLVGNSQGCSAVMLHSVVDPEKYAASNATDVKFNGSGENDANPECNYNDDNQGRRESRIFWGHEDSTWLYTDIPLSAGSSEYFRIYDLNNMNTMFHRIRNRNAPYLRTISGKTDEITCWQEKISVFDTIESTRMGGNFYWDLRGHGGTPDENDWPQLSIPYMLRFQNNKSYPAFSHTSLKRNAGSDTVTIYPYYDGDDIGSLRGAFNWRDSSLVDKPDTWQAELFLYQDTLNDESFLPAVLPDHGIADVTIRRPQAFRDFPEGTPLCWLNFHHGRLIQSGKLIQVYEEGVPAPLTVPGLLVYPDGNLLRVFTCESLQPTGFAAPKE